jgi:3',5'-cyclic AMP phosphodiesterase CpdA
MKTIAHLTDLHLYEDFPLLQGVDPRSNWQRALHYLEKQGVKDVVFGGDIGPESAHSHFFESLSGFNLNVVLGNHDNGELSTFSAAGKDGHYYLFEDDDYRYIILDSSAGRIYKQQLIWFKEAVRTEKKIILFVHHPIIPVPCYVETRHAMKGRELIQDILFEAGLEITIFCGHYHLEDERTEKNVRQMVTPAISYQMVKSPKKQIDNSSFGARLIRIYPEKIETEVITFNSALT